MGNDLLQERRRGKGYRAFIMKEQGKNISDDWYTCFDIMKLYGLGKTQVRRFAETHGVRIRKFKGGRANYYLKADWEAARKKAEKSSTTTKAKRK